MAVHHRKKTAASNNPNKSAKKPKKPGSGIQNFTSNGLIYVFVFLLTAGIAWSFIIYQRRLLFTPYSAPLAKDILKGRERDNKMLWGTYRSNLYFGMRTRTPESLLFGLLWFSQHPRDGKLHIRHSCEQGDKLRRYGWLYHDGKSFGVQEIVDDDFELRTEFLKQPGGSYGGDWTVRVKGRQTGGAAWNQAVSLLFAVTNEGKETLSYNIIGNKLVELYGKTNDLGYFKLKFLDPKGKIKLESYHVSYEDDIYDAKNVVSRYLQYHESGNKKHDSYLGLSGHVKNEELREPNFFIYQVTLELPFEIDVIFESASNEDRKQTLSGDYFKEQIQLHKRKFDEHFQLKFGLKNEEFSPEEIGFARAALSNMIGGIGYFYGSSIVISKDYKEPIDYWKAGLYSGVPSRSFFPRGFLWDEGFHQLQVQIWDPLITQDVIAHWLDLLNANGWIPREQILGIEARRKVPDEFVIQHAQNANPPTFFLTIESLIENDRKLHGDISSKLRSYLKHIYPRLKIWFNWYNTTQLGKEPATYRWHGRDSKSSRELNPKTLTSGLDDYPRASHPSDDERHVDLYCWIALASGILADISDVIGEDGEKYRSTELHLKNNELLNQLHWSEQLQIYADYGNHTKYTRLQKVRVGNHPESPLKLLRVVTSKQGPSLKYVNEFGYVSLFPFLLKILKPTSPKLKNMLSDIRNPDKLWTDYGLRSLSKTASMYDKYNTEHDKPYWRGPIWMNMNFLAVKSLFYYAKQEGPYKDEFAKVYKELRHNLVSNVYNQYKTTGYIWEQYNDKTGEGQGCYPFTGWSALVTMIMAEKY